jgi:hypothetical protein
MPNLIEKTVSLPVINPDTRRASRSFMFMGALDLYDESSKSIDDYKSTKDPERFIRERSINFQPELYANAVMAPPMSLPVEQVRYKLVTTPSIKFCGKDKDASAYEDRCFDWLCQPGKVVEHSIPIIPSRLLQAQLFLWDASKRVLDNRKTGRWMANGQACYSWERACPYMKLCEACCQGADVQWLIENRFKESQKHPELDLLVPSDKDILTYSSVTMLTLCEQKYLWRYEMGLVPRNDEDVEALWLGSAVHVGLAAMSRLGPEAANDAINEWEAANPAVGDGVRYNEQQCAKAKAMVRAASAKWMSDAA